MAIYGWRYSRENTETGSKRAESHKRDPQEAPARSVRLRRAQDSRGPRPTLTSSQSLSGEQGLGPRLSFKLVLREYSGLVPGEGCCAQTAPGRPALGAVVKVHGAQHGRVVPLLHRHRPGML